MKNLFVCLSMSFSAYAVLPYFPGNAGVTSDVMNQITGNCPVDTQNLINQITALGSSQQFDILSTVTPQYKVIQFSLEKLNFLIHKELKNTIYHFQRGLRPYVMGGFDQLQQKAVSKYTGYTVNSYYQLAGLAYGFNRSKFMGGLGASESYMSLTQTPSKATYPTVYGSLAAAYRSKHWRLGADGLLSCSFINAHRAMPFLGLKAKSNHAAWNASIDAHVSYKTHDRHISFEPYDDIGYLYGYENRYDESKAPGAEFDVKNEAISVLRNCFGVLIEAPRNKTTKMFFDLAWVYEHYFHNIHYKGAFIGTDVYGSYNQEKPAENYTRFSTGFMTRSDHIELQLSYIGLFGQNLMENAASLKITGIF